MGILNVTPDSFSDGGRFNQMDAFKRQAEQMVADGVDIFDVGGESTRPGAEPVSLEQELARVLPAIEWLHETFALPISVDTYKPEVMKQAVEAGANFINDVNALQAKEALSVVASLGMPVCLMHKQGEPKTMQLTAGYQDVVGEVYQFLSERIATCVQSGIAQESIMIDLGFGFGKRFEDNCLLFQQMTRFTDLGCPLLVGVSRKRMLGQIIDAERVEKRLQASVTAAVLAAQKGAAVVRVHDVKPTREALLTAKYLG
ncbi:MAG: dihydropteroate synthase [Thiotrichales bacterium]|nr:dihydropteroate synthase [Thiotrichales bacterium]